MGELHLEVLVNRMKREYKVEANIGKPQVAYRETIRKTVEKVRVHPQEADRWLGPVRPRDHQAGAARHGATARCTSSRTRSPAAASRGSTSRRSTPVRQDAMQYGVLAGYPLVGHQGDAARRRLPRGRLVGDGVQDRRLDGAQGGRAQGRPGPARADDGRRGHHARGLHGRRDRRPELPPRPDPGHGGAGRRPRRQGAGAAVGDVRLRRRPAVADPGPGELHDGVRLLRRGPDQRGQGDHRQGHAASSTGPGRATSRDHRTARLRPPSHGGADQSTGGPTSGEGEVRADQAARQHRHHRSHRPRQDHADRGDHQGPARQVPEPEPGVGVRPDRQGARGAAARHHHLDRARRVPDREAPLRARRLPRARRLHQEHDHRCRPDGRRDPGGRRDRRPDAADPRARAARPPGRRALHRGRAEQGRHGRRRGDPRARRARGPRAAVAQYEFPGDDLPVVRVSALKALEGDAGVGREAHGAHGRGRRVASRSRSATSRSRS